jgi:RNase P/RNase MRP subunit POP5
MHFGDALLGSSLASMQVKYLSLLTGLLVVRCGREETLKVQSSLALMADIGGRKVMMQTNHMSGSYRRARELAEGLHDLHEQMMRKSDKGISGNVSDALKMARERLASALDGP